MRKQIIFVESSPTVVTYKLAKALKNIGNEVILISFLKFDKDFYRDAYNKMICFDLDAFSANVHNFFNLLKNSSRILRVARDILKLRPDITIGVAAPHPIWLPAVARFIIRKSSFVFFPYDVNILKYKKNEYYKRAGIPNFELKAERYLFKNSDGIFFKGDEYEHVNKKIKIKCPIISFPSYISKDFLVPINKNKLSKKDRELHAVYIGFITEQIGVNSFGLGSWKDFIQGVLKEKIHFHVYTSSYENLKKLKTYQSILKNRYFHLNQPMGPREIVLEVSKYDFGLNPCSFDLKIINKEFVSSGTGNKTASFLEAGIPCIYDIWQTSSLNSMKKYNLNFYLSKDNLDEDLKKIRKIFTLRNKKIINGIKKAREDFTIEKHINELDNFLEKIKRN